MSLLVSPFLRSCSLLVCLTALAGAADNLVPWSALIPGSPLPEPWKAASAKMITVGKGESGSILQFKGIEGALVIASIEQPIPKGTKRLTLTARVRNEGIQQGESASNTGRIALQMFSGSARLVDKVQGFVGNGGWSKVTLMADCPPQAERFQVHFGHLKSKSGQLEVTDVTVHATP